MKDPYHSRALIKALNHARSIHTDKNYNFSCNQDETQIFVWDEDIENLDSPEDCIIQVYYVEDYYDSNN
jgi:hypothetical protein